MNAKVMACVDHSNYALGVSDYAAWAARRLGAPLEFIHVLDRHPETAPVHNFSGQIGLGARENLLSELADLDRKRSKLAQERGRELLHLLETRARSAGATNIASKQRHGEIAESLRELESEVSLFVLGKRGEAAEVAEQHLGRSLERVVRSLHRLILVVPVEFKPVRTVLIAFDGSATTRKGVERVASSPLFTDVHCQLILVGDRTAENEAQLRWALATLDAGKVRASGAIVSGQPEATLNATLESQNVDLLVMGAYGHSRIRQFLVGSTTTSMIRTSRTPVLLLR